MGAGFGAGWIIVLAILPLVPWVLRRSWPGCTAGADVSPQHPSQYHTVHPGPGVAVATLCVLDGQDYRRAVLAPDLVARLSSDYATATTRLKECSSTVICKVVGWRTWG